MAEIVIRFDRHGQWVVTLPPDVSMEDLSALDPVIASVEGLAAREAVA